MANVNLHPIEGFEDYQVSDNGLVYSLRSAKYLKPWFNGHHLQLQLNGLYRYVHILVLEAFVSPRPEGAKGLHWDDDPYNNQVGNLYWGSVQANALDRVRNGRDHNANKVMCKRGHDLAGPNLMPSTPPPHRRCLSCNRANTLAGWRGHRGDEAWIQRVSDEKFAALMIDAVHA